ncbi:MAG TPA: HAMP domain-containing sensor histidine kinase [Draconibacterium sp.]|nr:HAMP domain-containing sensor histidine kinase [Draconibacterium sp.]
MKLLRKLNTQYIVWSFFAMAFSGVVIYFVLSVIINNQMDERLTENLQTVEKQLLKSPGTSVFEPVAKIQKTSVAPEKVVFSDTLIYNEGEKEYEEYRQISAIKNIRENYYQIVLRKSKIESEDFLVTLALVTILGIFLLWLILLMVNRRVAKLVWQPFFSNLKKIEQFSITAQQPVQLNNTGISEFDQLNDVVTGLTRQIISDFQNQKQFSEDVSHELQTPLAIISSRLESLLGNPELNKHAEILNSIYISVRRLSKLNKALILLSKIENNQFALTEQSNLKTIIDEKLEEFSELIALKQLTLEKEITGDFVVPVPPALAGILISNLLSNSINHNTEGGKIRIEMNSNRMQICNSGTTKIADPEKLFNRFYKVDPASQSVGLGLAIVKKICDLHGLTIQYQFQNKMHIFTIKSRESENQNMAQKQ